MLVSQKNNVQAGTAAVKKPKSNFLVTFRGFFAVSFASMVIIFVLAFLLKDELKYKVFTWADAKGFGYIQKDSRLRDALYNAPVNYVASESLPKLVLDVKFKHMQKIFKKRSEALEKKFLVQAKDDFVPASIRNEGIDKKIKAKIRLKGDHVDHLKGEKWYFRVHTKKKHHFLGLRRFSVQHPKTRGFQQEPLFFQMLKQLNLLAPHYSFVDLTVNGKDIGVMAVEEHFSKEILEANGRKEGVIIRFDESIVFDARDGHERRMGLDGGAFDSYKNAPIDAFRTSRVKKSQRLSRDYRYAVGMLRGFVQGKMKASDVFDEEQMGKLAAAADLWGAWHVLVWRNIRFYLNPLTMKLEPIAYDANHDDREKVGTLASSKSQLFSEVLKDPKIFNVYKRTLIDLSNQVIRGDLIKTLKAKEAFLLRQLHNEYYMLPSIDFNYFSEQANFISTYNFSEYKQVKYHYTDDIALNDIRDIDYPRVLHAYITSEAGGTLEVANAVPHDVVITDVRLKSKSPKYPDILLDEVASKLPLTLSRLNKGDVPFFEKLKMRKIDGLKKYKVFITANINGNSRSYVTKATDYHSVLKSSPVLKSTIDEQLRIHKFMSLDKKDKLVLIGEGITQIRQSIIIPEGYRLKILPGAVLRFNKEAIILSYGAVEFIGSNKNPIILEPIDANSKNAYWQGIVVMNAIDESKLTNVVFNKTKGISQNGWQLTGGVTFYNSDVEINNVSFINHSGEDSLNIVHSNFEITDIFIKNSASDAFDADFSDGTFIRGQFKNIGLLGGGDGIDISGSNVVVKGTQFNDVSDKALSVGEKSNMRVENVFISNSGTGAASKDGSTLDIRNSEIKNIKTVGLMAYIKKPEYGGAKIVAKNIDFDAQVETARAQVGSNITIDGSSVEQIDLNVKEMYRTIMKPGLRK